MKGKYYNQEYFLYPARLSFRFDGEIKSFPRQAKVKRIQHHQTSFTTNAKSTSLGRKHKSRKRPTENKPKTIKKTVIGLYISISSVQFSSVTQLCPTLCNPWTSACQASCPSPTPGVYPNPCPLSRWCHPTISFSVIPFSSCPQLDGQSIGVSASVSVLPMNTQNWSPVGWTGWISLQSKGLSRVPGGPVVRTLRFHFPGPGFTP